MGSQDPIYLYMYVLIQYLSFSFWLTLEEAQHGRTKGFGISKGVIWLWRRYLFSLSFSGKYKMANQHLLCWGLNECLWDRWYSVDFCFFPLHFITQEIDQTQGLFCFWEGCIQIWALWKWQSWRGQGPKKSLTESLDLVLWKPAWKEQECFCQLQTVCSGTLTRT